MDALAGSEIDKLPFFFTTLYEKEALKLKEGQSEDWLDDDLRSGALAQGLCDIDFELPNAPDVLGAAASPLRRSSVSGNTQASCSTDITTPDSPASNDDRDRSFAASPPQRRSMSAAPHPGTYSRHSTSSLASYRNPKPSADDQGLRSPPKHSYSSIHRLGDVTGRITYKHPRVKEDSVTEFDAESALLPEHSRASSPDSVISHHPHVSATMTSTQRAALNLALENAQFRDLWQEYSKTWERIITFEVKQKLLFQFWEKFSRRSLYGQFAVLKDRLVAKHSQESERLDEKQLKAEYALEQAHREERARSAAALKHMKAYCSGSSVPGSTKRRIVTEDDKRRLREQEKLHDELDSKHEAAMKMTRARQEKDVKELKHEHEQEIKELEKKYKEARVLSRKTTQDVSHQLDDVIRGRRLRVVQRWFINLKLWDRATSDHDDVPAYTDLPVVPWPDKTVVETMTSRTYSVLDTWHTFNDLPPAVSLHVPVISESD
ncbi:ibr domain-containing protein [Diplodia corticola]|uniref:Ibr domain-containing protein n=1 Tax=Diplodia corticola TaxID=236234 RepID=A0A1J9RA51_9PEZI|nr:ibr domain-containing protein [Diplodia corticola]OJD37345.1 ibr domain-containing protein [Diplodia corticola]